MDYPQRASDALGYIEDGLDDVILMQFTGLQDSEGVDIYEGDVLRFGHQGDYYFTGPVKWREEVCGYGVVDLTNPEPEDLFVQADFPDTYTVIGNVFENPDLLE
jgi:uncharacterized phage protein (TIGR01671 family)